MCVLNEGMEVPPLFECRWYECVFYSSRTKEGVKSLT